MSAPVRVAHLDELPPGQGKRVLIGARDVCVWNDEGRYYAAATPTTPRLHVGADQPPGHARAVACEPLGARFDAAAVELPAVTGARYRVTVEGEYVIVYVDDPAAD